MSAYSTPINIEEFINKYNIPDDFLVYKFKLSDFDGGSVGFISRIVKTLEEYGVVVNESILLDVLEQIKQLNIILFERGVWEKLNLEPRVLGGEELIFENLINIFLPVFLTSLGYTIPSIIRKKAEANIEIQKQKELKQIEIEAFEKKLQLFNKYVKVNGATHEELLNDIYKELELRGKSSQKRI